MFNFFDFIITKLDLTFSITFNPNSTQISLKLLNPRSVVVLTLLNLKSNKIVLKYVI